MSGQQLPPVKGTSGYGAVTLRGATRRTGSHFGGGTVERLDELCISGLMLDLNLNVSLFCIVFFFFRFALTRWSFLALY